MFQLYPKRLYFQQIVASFCRIVHLLRVSNSAARVAQTFQVCESMLSGTRRPKGSTACRDSRPLHRCHLTFNMNEQEY